MKKESAGREAIAVLKEEKTWVTFVDNPAGNRYDQIEKVIYWCLYGAPVSPNGTVSSPVVAFYHEMGHGLQKKEGTLITDGITGKPNEDVEKENIRKNENVMSKEVGEAQRDPEEYDVVNYYLVGSSTTRGKLQGDLSNPSTDSFGYLVGDYYFTN